MNDERRETEELLDFGMHPVRIVKLGTEPHDGGDKGGRLVIFQTPLGSAKAVVYEDGARTAYSQEKLNHLTPRPVEDALVEVINDLYCQLFTAKVLLEHARRLVKEYQEEDRPQ